MQCKYILYITIKHFRFLNVQMCSVSERITCLSFSEWTWQLKMTFSKQHFWRYPRTIRYRCDTSWWQSSSHRIVLGNQLKIAERILPDFDPDTDPMPADAIFTIKWYRHPLAPVTEYPSVKILKSCLKILFWTS